MTYIEDGTCRLISRKQNQYKNFDPLAASLAKLPVKNARIDSEIVVLDAEGKSVFLDLMRRRRAGAILYCFDLLYHDGEDLRNLSLVDRKHRLQRLIRGHEKLLFADHIENRGVEFFKTICSQDLEGIVAKHKLAPYASTPQTWFKILNNDYTRKRGRKEMFENFRERNSAAVHDAQNP